jgi:hypothetical protein
MGPAGEVENARDIGRLSEAVRSLQVTVLELNAAVDNLALSLAEVKGGWRVVMWLAGAAAGLGTAIGAWIAHITGKPLS